MANEDRRRAPCPYELNIWERLAEGSLQEHDFTQSGRFQRSMLLNEHRPPVRSREDDEMKRLVTRCEELLRQLDTSQMEEPVSRAASPCDPTVELAERMTHLEARLEALHRMVACNNAYVHKVESLFAAFLRAHESRHEPPC